MQGYGQDGDRLESGADAISIVPEPAKGSRTDIIRLIHRSEPAWLPADEFLLAVL